MRKIYESDALERDSSRPFTPRPRDKDTEPQSFRFINSAAWSDRILPHRLRVWALRLSVDVPVGPIPRGTSVPFRVTVRNRLPIPISIRTTSPVLWTWSVDGHEEASKVPLRSPPETEGKFRLDRGSTIVFERTWNGHIRETDREWRPVDPGEHTIAAQLNTLGGPPEHHRDEATIEIAP